MAARSILDSSFWRDENNYYEPGGKLWAYVPKDSWVVKECKEPHELLWWVTDEVCIKRGLVPKINSGYIAATIGHSHGLPLVDDTYRCYRYQLLPDQPINVGVQSYNPYICYKNVIDEVEDQVKDNIDKAKNLSIKKWIEKVEGGGDWDYKTHKMTSRVFPTDFRSDYFPRTHSSQFFHMNGFTYNNRTPNLLRYDDVGNINYGATGKYIKEYLSRNHWLHLQELLALGGGYQQYTDISGELKFFFNGMKASLDPSSLNFFGGALPMRPAFMENVTKLNKRMSHRDPVGERNLYGDDPRDSYAIKWGYDNF